MASITAHQPLWVDFNEVYDDARVRTSLRHTVETVEVGQTVELRDDDGASCFGVVETVRGRSVTIRLAWSTWRSVRAVMTHCSGLGAEQKPGQ